jgi:hypothetical protein
MHIYAIENGNFQLESITASALTPRSTMSTVLWKNKIIAFGGCEGLLRTYFNDIHIFDTSNALYLLPKIIYLATKTWEETSHIRQEPPARCFHIGAVYKDDMYIFGGYTGSSYLNDMWKFNLGKKLPPLGN